MCGSGNFQCAYDNIHTSHCHYSFWKYDDEGVISHLKPATERMLNRVRDIYMYILENGTVTTKNVVEEFDITSRMAQRDLNVLEYNDLVASPVRGKWTTTQKETS